MHKLLVIACLVGAFGIPLMLSFTEDHRAFKKAEKSAAMLVFTDADETSIPIPSIGGGMRSDSMQMPTTIYLGKDENGNPIVVPEEEIFGEGTTTALRLLLSYPDEAQEEYSKASIDAAVTEIQGFVNRFSKVIQREEEKFGIPQRLKIAQAMLETNLGRSTLAREDNNWFGMKYFGKAKDCKKCRNLHDDDPDDLFHWYPSAWRSFRAHSKLLKANYPNLFRYPPDDIKSWIIELRNGTKGSYATDIKYSWKLLMIVQNLDYYKIAFREG